MQSSRWTPSWTTRPLPLLPRFASAFVLLIFLLYVFSSLRPCVFIEVVEVQRADFIYWHSTPLHRYGPCGSVGGVEGKWSGLLYCFHEFVPLGPRFRLGSCAFAVRLHKASEFDVLHTCCFLYILPKLHILSSIWKSTRISLLPFSSPRSTTFPARLNGETVGNSLVLVTSSLLHLPF